jgi:hypothetical protein
LTADVFFDLLFYAVSLSHNCSLESLVSCLESKYGIEMRKQSLDERFSERAVNFIKRVLVRLISEQFLTVLYREDFLSDFKHVRIKDSTKFNVPSNLKEHYQGSGGSGSVSEAGISIQYEFDLKTGKFLDLTITEAVRNDRQDAKETVENICKNDLILRDSGYFSTPVLQKIDEKEVFFLSRLPSNVPVYDENGVEIDFKDIYSFMSKNGIGIFEKQVFIGSKGKVPVRLVIGPVPPQIYQERLRRREKEEKRRGRKTRDKTKFLLYFNLFVTNIVNLQTINQVQSTLSKQGINDSILSYQKTLQTTKNSFSEILNILRCEKEIAITILEKIYLVLSKNHWREKRKERENHVENIDLFTCVLQK